MRLRHPQKNPRVERPRVRRHHAKQRRRIPINQRNRPPTQSRRNAHHCLHRKFRNVNRRKSHIASTKKRKKKHSFAGAQHAAPRLPGRPKLNVFVLIFCRKIKNLIDPYPHPNNSTPSLSQNSLHPSAAHPSSAHRSTTRDSPSAYFPALAYPPSASATAPLPRNSATR